MKKVVLVILFFLIVTACTNLSIEDKTYINNVKKLEQREEFDTDFPFDIDIRIERLTDYEITYHLVIDNFKEGINNIKAIVIHNRKTEDVFPSIGIYDKKVDLTKESKKGILLVGYIDYKKDIKDFKGTFKASISYTQNTKGITKYYKKSFKK